MDRLRGHTAPYLNGFSTEGLVLALVLQTQNIPKTPFFTAVSRPLFNI